MGITMNTNKDRQVGGFVFLLAAVLAMAGTAQADVRVGGYSLRVNGQVVPLFEYTGSCPADLKFGWGVIGTEPTTVTYSFVRSDGASSPGGTAQLPNANRSVPIYYDWRLGENSPQFATYSGWVQINIESPNSVSQKIPFTLHCR
jgi:hypothetical protein